MTEEDTQKACPVCDGTGTVSDPSDDMAMTCPKCHGSGKEE